MIDRPNFMMIFSFSSFSLELMHLLHLLNAPFRNYFQVFILFCKGKNFIGVDWLFGATAGGCCCIAPLVS